MGAVSIQARLAALALVVTGLTLTGCAAQAGSDVPSAAPDAVQSAASGAGPSVAPPGAVKSGSTPSAAPDLSIRRSVTLSDGSTATICATVSVERDSATEDANTDDRLAKARAILADPKWQSEPVSLSDLPADEQQRERAKGEDEATMLAGLLHNHISDAIMSAGLLGEGVSLAGHVGCK